MTITVRVHVKMVFAAISFNPGILITFKQRGVIQRTLSHLKKTGKFKGAYAGFYGIDKRRHLKVILYSHLLRLFEIFYYLLSSHTTDEYDAHGKSPYDNHHIKGSTSRR